jgi:hypothetical protein
LNTKIILIATISSIIILSSLFLISNSEIRYVILQAVDVKQTPKLLTNSYTLEAFAVGIPFPYHLTVLDDDVFFNQRHTGKLYVIKDEEFQNIPVLQFDSENSRTKILGISSNENAIFVHVAENNENRKFENNRILKYSWDGNSLNLIQEVVPQSLFTDEHHSGDILVIDDGEVLSTLPINAMTNDEAYFIYGIHGFDFDSLTKILWHTSEIEWPEKVEDIDSIDKYEKIHMFKPETNKAVKYWEVPYYPNSLLIPENNISKKFQQSLFVGFCKGVNSGGGLYEYPLTIERNGFAIPNTDSSLLNFDHEQFLIAENFYCISDMELGPDNTIYLTDYVSNGAIYKIAPKK